MPLATGARLGPYEILAPIGAGGMSEVYRARDTRLSREVATRLMRRLAFPLMMDLPVGRAGRVR